MPDLVSMIDLNLNGTHIFAATSESVSDEVGQKYFRGLAGHPAVTLRLSDGYQGTVEIGQIDAELVTLSGEYVSLLRSSDIRNCLVTYRLFDLETLTCARTIVGKVQRGSFTSAGTFQMTIADQSGEVLSTPCPKMIVAGDLFGSEETNNLDLNLPVPIVLGSTREHVPCRYVEEDQARNRYRYVFGSDLSASVTDEPVVTPYPNSVYQVLNTTPSVLPSRNYVIEASESLPTPDGPISGGTMAGTLSGSSGKYHWVYTVQNGVGETTASAPYKQEVAFDGASVGGQKLIWVPSDSPDATAFLWYRSDDSGATWALIQEVTDPNGFRATDDEGNVYFQLEDNGLLPDTDITPPTENTTRAGVVSIVFDRLQYGQSSQLVPITADVEYTEIAKRSDSLGYWLFRNDIRDLVEADQPRMINGQFKAFWDFSERPTGSGTYNETTGVSTNGAKGVVRDRANSYHLMTKGDISTQNYIEGVDRYSALTGLTSQSSLFMPSGSAVDFNFGASTSFRAGGLARPALGTGFKSMVLLQKQLGVAKFWSVGTAEGAAWGRVGTVGGTIYEVKGTSSLDGGWHDIEIEVTRAGTTQGTPPVPSPAFYYSTQYTTKRQNIVTFPMASLASSTNPCIVVSVHTRDGTAIRTPASVSFNGVDMNSAVTSSGSTGATYLSTSVWDKISPVSNLGFYNVIVTFPAGVQPDSIVCTASCLFNVNQGAGTSYRDVTASAYSASAAVSLLSITPAEAQNKSFMFDAITYPDNTTSFSVYGGQTKRSDGSITGAKQVRGLSSTRAEVGSGAQTMGWYLSEAEQFAHAAVAYKPLASATTSVQEHDYLNIYVDKLLEGSTVIDGVGTLGSTGNFAGLYVGQGELQDQTWEGDIDSLWVIEGTGGASVPSPFTYANGKANSGPSALVCTDLPHALFVPSTSAYSPGTSDFTLEGWATVSEIGDSGTIFSWGGGAVDGYLLTLLSNGSLAFSFSQTTGLATVFSSTSITAGEPFFFSVAVQRETALVDGLLTIFLNDDNPQTANIPAGTPANFSVATMVTIAADGSSGSLLAPFVGSIDELHLFAGLRTEADARKIWGLGTRNVVAQIQALLESGIHGPGAVINHEDFSEAMQDIKNISAYPNSFVTDYAIVEQRPLRDHLSELLRVRGIQLGTDSDGNWTITVDKTSAPTKTFAFGDGRLESISQRPIWTTSDIKEVPKNMLVRYRPRRNSTGGIDSFILRTPKRNVMTTIGIPIEVPIASIRDRETADRFADYFAKKVRFADQICSFQTGFDGLELELGEVIFLTDTPTLSENGYAKVSELRIQGMQVSVEARGWDEEIFQYEAKTLPQDLSPEDIPSYEGQLPPPPTSVVVTYDVSSVDATVVRATVTWNPPITNYGGARISYRQSGLDSSGAPSFVDPWRYGVEVDKNNIGKVQLSITVGAAAVRDYIFAVQSRSPSGIYSIFARSDTVSIDNT